MESNSCPVEKVTCQAPTLECPGQWNEWSQWSKCVGGCDGNQFRSRHCFGKNCLNRSQSEAKKCPCEGTVSEWSDWSSCSRTCGIGFKQRNRVCSSQFCREPLTEKKPCYTVSCDIIPGGYDGDGNNSGDGDNDTSGGNGFDDGTNGGDGGDGDSDSDGSDGGPSMNFTCPIGMEKSNCLSVCTIKSCEDLNNPIPLEFCSTRCSPGCICPTNTVESEGVCISVNQCHCKDSTGRYWPPNSSWKVHGKDTCSTCECENGLIRKVF